MKFLEVTTESGKFLVRTEIIKWVKFDSVENGYKIIIYSDDREWKECFLQTERQEFRSRCEHISRILNME